MRKLAWLLALLLAAPAAAQTPYPSPRAIIAPTPANGDNSNRVATTAFVQNSVSAPALLSGLIFIGNVSNFAQARAMSGDCTISVTGVVTCTQSAGAFTVNGTLTVNGAIIDTSGNATLKTVILPGSTSGSVTVKAPAIAGANTLTLPAGTTDFSATGGTSQFVKQATLGGALTVGQVAFSDLTGSGTCAQQPALTGDVTTPAGSCATTIAASAVTLGKMANLTGLSVIGNAGTVSAAPTAITGTTDQIARINTAGTALAFGSINLAGSGAVGTSLLPLANGGSNAALTASNGGLVFSTGSAFSILAGTATAGQIPRSGANAVGSWSTATYPATTAAGNVLASSSANVIAGTATPVLGAVGTTGTLGLSGTTSGTATITPQATAGSPTLTLPNTTGTFAVGATSPLTLSATTGGLTCTTCVTSSGGGAITGTAPVVASAAGAISVQGATGQVLTGSGGTGSAFSATPTLGAVGTQGTLALAGTTSGTVTQTTQAAAGAPTVTWGSGTGTPAVTATGPLAITAATGNVTCATCATTTNGGALSGTAPIAVSAAGAISITSPLPIANGGTAQATAPAARASSGLNIDQITGHGDSIYTILATDRTVATNAAFTASRTWTLPAANAVNPGQQLLVADFQGTVTATNTLIISRGGTDTINGGTTVTISSANGAYLLWSDGTSKWTAQAIGGGATAGVSTFSGRSGTVAPQADDYGKFNVVQGATNCSITASVVSNNLTITMTDAAGATPSATTPCVVNFRNATATSGTTVTRTVTSATTLVLNSGSTLGVANATAFRVWVEFVDTGATAVLGASVQTTFSTTAATISTLSEDGIISTTACSACATATAARTIYTTAAQTTKPYRLAGYLDWGSGLTTAGTWATAPTVIQPWVSGMSRPGTPTGQSAEVCTTTGAANITSTTYSAALSTSLTPTSAANLVKVIVTGEGGPNPSLSVGHLSLFRGTTAGTMVWSSNVANTNTGAVRIPMGFEHLDAPQTASAQTYTAAVNGDGTNAFSYGNGGDVAAPCFATMILHEIMGANDNQPDWLPLVKAG